MANRFKSLLEGFSDQVGKTARQYFARSPRNQVADLRRGGTPSIERAGLPFTLASQFGYDTLSEHMRIDQDIQSRYADYEEMEQSPEISVALDIYADDSTTPDSEHEDRSIWAVSDQQKVQDELNTVLHRRLLVDDDVWGNTRTVSKYGDNYGELIINEQGLQGIQFVPPPTIRRVEDPRGTLLGFVQDIRGQFNISLEDFYTLAQQRGSASERLRAPGEATVFEDWEIVHWRLRGKHLRSVYGHGLIDPARWIWKRLSLLEDALLIYKLERAPSRYAFYVDVGQLDAERGLAHVNRVKNMHTRKRFVNSQGKLDFRYHPLSGDEDFWVAARDGKKTTEIDVLQGPDYSEVESLEYNRDKLVSALKIPKAYMGFGGEATRNALSSEDIRFARTVMRLQKVMRGGYKQALYTHLVAIGANPEEIDFDVRMAVPSQILELSKVEVMSATADLAGRMGELVSSRWILTKLFGFTEDEAAKVMSEREGELRKKGELEAEVAAIGMAAQAGVEGPAQESGTSGANSAVMLEQRLSRLIRAERREWQREFDSGRKADSRLESKFADLVRRDHDTRRTLKGLGGLLSDIRSSMRNVSVP